MTRTMRFVPHRILPCLGAKIAKKVRPKVDYLVVGELVDADWFATGDGRKVDKALYYKDAGVPM